MAVKKPVKKEQPEQEVSVYKADTANRRTALFFTIIAVAAVLLLIVIINLPKTTTPTVTAPVDETLIHNKSEVIDFNDAENKLVYKDESGRPHEYPLAADVIITKGTDTTEPGDTTDLVPQALVHVIVEKGAIARIHVVED